MMLNLLCKTMHSKSGSRYAVIQILHNKFFIRARKTMEQIHREDPLSALHEVVGMNEQGIYVFC